MEDQKIQNLYPSHARGRWRRAEATVLALRSQCEPRHMVVSINFPNLVRAVRGTNGDHGGRCHSLRGWDLTIDDVGL